MRTRTSNDIVVGTSHPVESTLTTVPPDSGDSKLHGLLGSDAGITHTRGYGHESRVGVSSTITDVIGNRGGYNDCAHTTEVWDCPEYLMKYTGQSTEHLNRLCEAVTERRTAVAHDDVSWKVDAYPTFWVSEESAISRATSRMQFGLQDSGFNAPVFLGELRDFRHVFGRASGRLKMRRKDLPLNDSIRKTVASLKNASLRDAIKGFASMDLFHQFAVKPFMSDMEALRNLDAHMRKQFDRLSSLEPVRVAGRFFERGQEVDTFDDPQIYEDPREHVRTYERLTTAYAKVQYKPLAALDIGPLAAAGDALGFDQPLTAVWELIPFSFAVDYFYAVGEFLNQFETDFVSIPYEIIEQGASVRTEVLSVVTQSFDRGNTTSKYSNLNDQTPIKGSLLKRKYTRTSQILPYGEIRLPQLKIPNERQVWNLIEIAILKAL